ncbi:nicotinamide-nucleotide adenylyltransferase [Candidatus Woesearchaeota archaeon]|nr:nicotinamide-nucleotide adenylyltransferase [Candidatus Woesearchaeota archaeon]
MDSSKKSGVALFIGRFQPFHKGHLKVVKDLSRRFSLVKIVIGSSQLSGTVHDPYHAGLRRRMVHNTLKKEGIRNYRLMAIRDIESDSRYAAHVRKIVGHFDVVYSGTPLVKKLFKKAGFKVIHLPRYYGLSATKIRHIMKKAGGWEKFVHKEVRKLLG